ncbi:flagellar basal body-associated FliL family protein [Thermaerobacter sp. PB12/4term]|uniref:flagellar basal body-associated FliL family protein n=1 Tax=Thermaerobacter sp. PB12/4term TaxID=2293838 RepID=UPI000E32B6D7|nr:flagellar basal body-associated FliL family protein [Thermaerobacter sp. PB12/4term]QIA26941.1 flagellar basal body-associated FliL family protein [Thermaerobacter sp. PB12/4term]
MKGKLRLLLIVVVTAVAAAAGTWWAATRAGAGEPPPPPEPVDVALEPFTTNLRDGRVVQVALVLRVAGEEAAQALEHGRTAEVRHQVYRVLRGMTAADLAGAGGMDRLQQALRAVLAGQGGGSGPGEGDPGAGSGLPAGSGPGGHAPGGGLPIQDVLITDLIVQ